MRNKGRKEESHKNALPEGLVENIFKSVPHPFYVIDANSYQLIISKPAHQLEPYSVNEKCHSFFHNKENPCHVNGDHCIIEEVKKSKKSQKKDYFHYNLDGNLTIYEIHAHPIYGEHKQVSHVILNYFDVTELKHFQEMLSKSEEAYRTLVQSIHGYLYSIRYSKTENSQIYHSPQCERITGYTPKEYINDPHLWIKMVHPADVDLVSDFFNNLMKSGKSKRIEHRIIHKLGHIIWVLNQCTVTTDDSGEPERADGIILDITDKKKAEESVINSEKMYRTVISTTVEGYIRFNSNYEIIDTNTAMCHMLGHEKEQLTGKNISLLVSEEKVGFLMDSIIRIEEDNHINFEVDLEAKEGKPVASILSATILRDSENNFSGGFAFFTNITRLRDTERELISAKEKAEEATEVKDKFVSLVAHDLKGPITSIWGYLQILHDEACQGKVTPTFIDEAMSSCQDMTTLISEILSLSRIKTGHLTPHKSFLNARKLMEYIVHNFSILAGKKEVKIINSVPENIRIYADEKLFYEVIRNLVSNAIKFTSKGDNITIFVPGSEPTTIAISDTGTGMSPDYMKGIFKFEEKTSMKGTSNESGTGFGLPLAKDIMKAHNGDLYVESVPGKGSTFYARLPKVRPVILIVEDEEPVANSISQILSIIDAKIEIALTVNHAEQLIEEALPHLILLDILIPEIDGFHLLEHVMSNPDTRHTPVIVITGDPDIETRNRVFQLGAADFVTKPFQREDLLPRVKRFVW